MPTKASVLAALRSFVDGLSRPYSEEKYNRCVQDCWDHDLFGPYLQFKKDDFHLGQWYVLCHVDHPRARGRPRPTFKYISPPLTSVQRGQVRDWAATHGVTLSSPARGREFNIDVTQAGDLTIDPAPTDQAGVIDLTDLSDGIRSPSVEITRVVPAPLLRDVLLVYYFFEDKTMPKIIELRARASINQFLMRHHERQLLDHELKQSDTIDILTFGAPGFEMWSKFYVRDLAIPRTIPAIVISRTRVHKFHPSIEALYEYAYQDAAKLPERIVDPDDVPDSA
ncbi:unnamed protein product [Peniophora sp. CBMAI 1063]|nr:unnamed protein product [Peniophora sp. CBMAI 1063]